MRFLLNHVHCRNSWCSNCTDSGRTVPSVTTSLVKVWSNKSKTVTIVIPTNSGIQKKQHHSNDSDDRKHSCAASKSARILRVYRCIIIKIHPFYCKNVLHLHHHHHHHHHPKNSSCPSPNLPVLQTSGPNLPYDHQGTLHGGCVAEHPKIPGVDAKYNWKTRHQKQHTQK